MAPNPDNPLAAARRGLAEAVFALAEPQPIWVGGICRWADPVYVRLRDALKGSKVIGRRQVPDSRLPCRTDILTLIIELDMTVAEWQPDGEGALDRLRRLRDRAWRPEDIELLESHHAQLQRWTVTAVELLGDTAPTVALRLPCPACGTKHVYRRNQVGETVRVWALQVSEDGCRCQRCHAAWQPEQFEFLATRLLGLPALPAV
jgi:hypothetical protein